MRNASKRPRDGICLLSVTSTLLFIAEMNRIVRLQTSLVVEKLDLDGSCELSLTWQLASVSLPVPRPASLLHDATCLGGVVGRDDSQDARSGLCYVSGSRPMYSCQGRLNSRYVIMADRTDLWGVTRSPCSTVQSSDRVMVSAVNLELRSAHFTVQLGPN